ncbi:MAG: sugar phosphate nucleotidyltransferase [Candidatus Poseidoniaceae archaeon]|nr:sugar phosphate nucleotidyltransferase [Candidatus Poseidoniaceae archaeon]
MNVKAILVAGGHGSRLAPFTRYTQKTLLPIHERPVIDYALGTIRRAGIQDITIIANRFIGQIAQHVGAGLPGERIHYVMEEDPLGVAHALSLARPHNENSRLLIYFSDNITTVELDAHVTAFREATEPPGAVLLAREEADPRAFGVAVLNDDGDVVDIVEKPENPPSNLAIGGIYLYDERFWTFVDEAVASKGSAFSISDINRRYVEHRAASLLNVGEETWIDCGTPATLLQASIMAKEGRLNPHPHRDESRRE